jgi:hypothetical protein
VKGLGRLWASHFGVTNSLVPVLSAELGEVRVRGTHFSLPLLATWKIWCSSDQGVISTFNDSMILFKHGICRLRYFNTVGPRGLLIEHNMYLGFNERGNHHRHSMLRRGRRPLQAYNSVDPQLERGKHGENCPRSGQRTGASLASHRITSDRK